MAVAIGLLTLASCGAQLPELDRVPVDPTLAAARPEKLRKAPRYGLLGLFAPGTSWSACAYPAPAGGAVAVQTILAAEKFELPDGEHTARNPWGLFVDAAGTVTFSCQIMTGQGTMIYRLNADGQLQKLYTGADRMGFTALGSDANGDLIAADNWENRVVKFSSIGIPAVVSPAGHKLYNPMGVLADAGGTLYVAEANGHRITRIAAGGASVFVGKAGNPQLGGAGFVDGLGTAARLNGPMGMAWDCAGNLIFADSSNHSIRKVTPGGQVVTLAGNGEAGHTDAAGKAARFDKPVGVAVDPAGVIYVADYHNRCIRRIDGDLHVTTLAKTVDRPTDVKLGPDGAVYFIEGKDLEHPRLAIRKIVSL